MAAFRPLCCLPLALCAVACVPGVPHFVTNAESRAGHPYENAEYHSAELALTDTPPETKSKEGQPSTSSYWHYNGLGYELVPGREEAPTQPYLWPWRESAAQ